MVLGKNGTEKWHRKKGHGKNDNIVKGPKIMNYVLCRHNFPQFPMNKTKFILGMSKDLESEEVRQRKNDLLTISTCFDITCAVKLL